jgi:Tfp pilus assembly protein PilO
VELESLRAVARRLPAAEALLQRTEISLPSAPQVDRVIDEINGIAVADGVAWTNESQSLTTTGTSATGVGGGSVLGLTLDVSGTFAHVSRFLTDLEQRPRLIVVASLSYSPNADGRGLALNIDARAYYDPSPIPVLPAALLRS